MAERATPRGPDDHEPVITAHDLLAPAVRELGDRIREAAARVAATAAGQARGDAGYDAEAIHDFRVGLRRLRTLLRPARAIYGKQKIRAAGAELRRFAQATGIVRDRTPMRTPSALAGSTWSVFLRSARGTSLASSSTM